MTSEDIKHQLIIIIIILNQTCIYKNFKNQNMQKYYSCENFHEVKLRIYFLFLISPMTFLWQPLLSYPDVEQQNQAPEVSMQQPW